MKTRNILFTGLVSVAALLSSCNDFQEINEDPNLVGEDKVKPQWFLNASIMGDQMNPEIAERIFILYWDRASRFNRGSGFTIGTDNNDYSTIYLSNDYAVGWLNQVTKAIQLGEQMVANGEADTYPYYKNVIQMSRIWRAYLNSEVADGFGPIPALAAFSGVPAEYDSVEAIYQFILKELREAESALDPSLDMSAMANEDAFYAGNVAKWKKYANSLRMRLAMRISAVDPALAKAEFEDAASKTFISEPTDIASVQEKEGWDELTSVMSRPWNAQPISVTINNMMIGLGGIDFQVPAAIKEDVVLKDARNYLGLRLEKHLPVSTNDPAAGYFFDALPSKIDPRATKLFHIPGYDDGTVYFSNIGLADKARLADPATGNVEDNNKTYLELNVKYTWNTWVAGKWDKYSALTSELTGASKTYPSLSKIYRESTNKRVWFGPWETEFLLAEAALYGWNVSGSAKSHYEAGIAASFEYHGVSEFLNDYLSSTEYNRVGTSVAFDHTAEAKSYTAEYVDGYTGEKKTTTYTYPKNSIYKNGTVNNDKLTKIISQKYLAQVPWLPLEAWSDHRRLGLPFFENQAVEIDYNVSSNELPLTRANCKECKWEFYQERLRYPANMEINSKDSYMKAVELLGGADLISTPLWWAKH